MSSDITFIHSDRLCFYQCEPLPTDRHFQHGNVLRCVFLVCQNKWGPNFCAVSNVTLILTTMVSFAALKSFKTRCCGFLSLLLSPVLAHLFSVTCFVSCNAPMVLQVVVHLLFSNFSSFFAQQALSRRVPPYSSSGFLPKGLTLNVNVIQAVGGRAKKKMDNI